MTAHISAQEAQAWAATSKLTVTSIEPVLEADIANMIIGKLSSAYDTSSWADPSTTPSLVRSIIAMYYIAWIYDRTFSEDSEEVDGYSALLRREADKLLADIVAGTITLPDIPAGTDLNLGGAGFYPTDASTLMRPTFDDTSLGGPAFSMGKMW